MPTELGKIDLIFNQIGITDACVRALDVKPETVRILLQDIATQDFGVAGESVRAKRERQA